MRVFISSTCYDLIDLRAEIADFFRQAGVEPVLSDDPISDFHSKTDANSIEACLANVRSCDAFIIILSNRYGPKVNIQPYDGKSATHLEYEEAMRCNKDVWMYVRDRLDGEYALWKRNKNLAEFEPAWVPRKDWGLFDLFEAHRALPEDAQRGNWFSTFKDSTQLKRIIQKDFEAVFARAAAQSLFMHGRIPLIEVSASFETYPTDDTSRFRVALRNLTQTPAISPVFSMTPSKSETYKYRYPVGSLTGNAEIKIPFLWDNQQQDYIWTLTYSILEGHTFEDSGVAWFNDSQNGDPFVIFKRKKRSYVKSSMELLIDQSENA